MFSRCLPLSRSRGPRTGPREGLIQRCRHWARAQHRRLWPSARGDPKSCLRKTEDLGDLPPCSRSERPVWHIIEESSLEPRPEDGQRRAPTQSLAQVYIKLFITSSDLEHQVHLPPGAWEDLQAPEAEPEAPVPPQDPDAETSEEPGVGAGARAASEPEEGPPPTTGPPPEAALEPGPASGGAPLGHREPTPGADTGPRSSAGTADP